MKPADVKSLNDKNPKFKIGDIVRISKYQNIFAKSYVLWKYVISDLNSEEIVGEYYRKKKSKEFRFEQLLKRKSDNYTLNHSHKK